MVKVSSGEMGGRRMNLNHDVVDGIFKLRSSSKIAFDIGIHLYNKGMKNILFHK